MSAHTTNQHIVPKLRFKYFDNPDKQHHEYFKNGRYSGYRGIGNGIAVSPDLYEPENNEYKPNEIEKDLFANDIEPKWKSLIDEIIRVVNGRNVLASNKIGDGLIIPTNNILNYNNLKSFVEISFARLPDSVKSIQINKLNFFNFLQSSKNNVFKYQFHIWYIEDENLEFLMPDLGAIGGTTDDFNLCTLILTPKICLTCIFEKNVNKMPIVLQKINKDYVELINDTVKKQCDKKFISHKKL